jgi:ABC-type transport system involved in multi-copper enzyme maturation permease subunit
MAGVQQEVSLTAFREIRKNLRSAKGIAMCSLFFLGGAVPSVGQVLLTKATASAGLDNTPDQVVHEARVKLYSALSESEAVGNYLATCPDAIYWFLLYFLFLFLPLLVLLVGFDQVAGEIQYRSIRYVVGRSRRASFVVGKALGLWAVIATVLLLLHVTVWVVMLIRGTHPPGDVLSWGLRVWLFGVAYSGAWVGYTTLVSSLFRTPIVAMFTGAGIGSSLLVIYWILRAIGEKADAFTWIFPNRYEWLMVSPDPVRAIGGCALCIAWGALCVLAATWIVRRRDI